MTMRLLTQLSLSLAILGLAFSSLATGFSSPSEACNTFFKAYPNATFFPLQLGYIEANTGYYTSSAALNPACVFEPSTAEQLSFAVKTLVRLDTLFAVVGGGHMPIPGSNNINATGVLIACRRLDQLRISPDGSTVHVGPGNRWVDVYRFLAPYNCSAVGGRVGHVGVPGYLLGGGVSFFGNEYGWASDNVVSFTAVLANGSIVTATPTNAYSDLFWALRGGGNSFALVTDFELKTVPVLSGKVYVGAATFDASVSSAQFLDKVYEYGLRAADDPKAAVIPLVEFFSDSTTPSYSAYLFYNGENSAPEPLEPFLSLPQTSSTFRYRSMDDWSLETDAELLLLTGFRQRFWVLPVGLNRMALQIIHDTYLDAVQQFNTAAAAGAAAGLGGIYLTALAMMPVPRTFFTASNDNPQGVNPDLAPYVWIEESFSYTGTLTDSQIDAFYLRTNANITSKLREHGISIAAFHYLNDANELQTDAVWAGIPAENVRRLKGIRDRYDPEMVFTRLLPGGWKVEDAKDSLRLIYEGKKYR